LKGIKKNFLNVIIIIIKVDIGSSGITTYLAGPTMRGPKKL